MCKKKIRSIMYVFKKTIWFLNLMIVVLTKRMFAFCRFYYFYSYFLLSMMLLDTSWATKHLCHYILGDQISLWKNRSQCTKSYPFFCQN
jgi:hypothetical protein